MTERATAIVPFTGPEALQPDGTPFSAHGGIQLSERGLGVYAFLALAWYDRRTNVASYALRVVNATGEPVLCHCYEIRLGGVMAEVYPVPLIAAANSVMDTFVLVRTDAGGGMSRLVVDVQGPSAALRVEAPAPAKPRSRLLPLLGWSAALLALVIAVAVAAVAARPHLTLFDPPARALAGTALMIPYARGGLGTLQYELLSDDGRMIAADTIATPVGVLRVALPKAQQVRQTYHLRLRAVGPLGTQTRNLSVVALASERIDPAQQRVAGSKDGHALIGKLIAPSPVRADHDIHVSYLATATSGNVWLADFSGKIWASVPFSVNGTSLLHVPAAAAGREMHVVLQVQYGSQRATSSVGVVIEPDAATAERAPAAPAPDTVAATNTAGAETTLTTGIELSQTSVAPGESVRVRIVGPHDDAVVTLTDASGRTIEQGDASGQERGITLTAPSVDAPTTFYVVAAITNGVSQTSMVRKLIVAPAR